MSIHPQGRAIFKFGFWLFVSVGMFLYVIQTYRSGTMIHWYYYTAANDGYAVNANTFMAATKQNPAILSITSATRVEGLMAVPVKKGERLPQNINGVISTDELKKGKRAVLEGSTIKVFIPWEIKEAKGFKYKDTFKHKGIKTNPWAGIWNVVVVLILGLALGLLAEGFTDVLGIKLEKIDHSQSH
jgi:hypothetical protein